MNQVIPYRKVQVAVSRFVRKLVSLIGIAAVVFAQLAVSAYACPLQSGGMEPLTGQADSPVIDSNGRDAAAPALCQKHCDNDQQIVKDSQTPIIFVVLLFAPPMALPQMIEPAGPFVAAPPSPSLQHATSPPLSIQHCCFRI